MKTTCSLLASVLSSLVLAVACLTSMPSYAAAQERLTVYQTTLEEPNQLTPEITTEEMQRIMVTGSELVLDVRSQLEYAIAHIPGSVNIYEREVERIVELYPDTKTPMVLYCNGPFCGKSKRTSEQLVRLGYSNVRRYQLGMPVWRALGNTVQTDLDGFRYVFKGDKTAIYVDARSREEFMTGSVPRAVSILAGEADRANEDGRLPQWDKGTRIVVFANSAQEARIVAAEIARKAYWNSSYFGGTFAELQRAGLW